MTKRIHHILRLSKESGLSILTWIIRFFSSLSFQDIAAAAGLSSLAYGLHLLSPPLAFIVVGSIIFILSVTRNFITIVRGR